MHLYIGAPKYIKQILTDIKREVDRNRVKVGECNTGINGRFFQTENKATYSKWHNRSFGLNW